MIYLYKFKKLVIDQKLLTGMNPVRHIIRIYM